LKSLRKISRLLSIGIGNMAAALVASPPKTRKKLRKRRTPDRSQRLRRAFQLAFLTLNLWSGTQFVLFVHYYESGGHGMRVARPAGVEGWLPIASLMNLKVLLATGHVPRVHPAGMFLLIAFLAISWLLRKSFCAWLCPVGTVSGPAPGGSLTPRMKQKSVALIRTESG